MLDMLRSADDLPRADMQRLQASLLVHVCVSRMNNSVDTDTSLNICDGPLLDIIKKLTQNLVDFSQFAGSNVFPLLQLGELYHDNLLCCIIERVGLGFYQDIAEFKKLILLELDKPFGSPRGNTSVPQVSQSLDSSQGCPPNNVEQIGLLASRVVEDMEYDENLADINSPCSSPIPMITSDFQGLEELSKDFPKFDDARQWVSLLNAYPSKKNPHETESVDNWKVYLQPLEEKVAAQAYQTLEARADTRLVEDEMARVFIPDESFDGHTFDPLLNSALEFTDERFANDLIIEGAP